MWYIVSSNDLGCEVLGHVCDVLDEFATFWGLTIVGVCFCFFVSSIS